MGKTLKSHISKVMAPLQEYSFLLCIRYLQNHEPNRVSFVIEQNNALVYKSQAQTGIKLNWNKQRVTLDHQQSFTIVVLKNDTTRIGQVETTLDEIEIDNKVEFAHLTNPKNNFNAYIYTSL